MKRRRALMLLLLILLGFVVVVSVNLASGDTAGTGSQASGKAHRPPVRKRLPKISGVPAIGYSLDASPGRWKGATRFAYRWVRCNARGNRCQAIRRVKPSRKPWRAYTLTNRDVGHTIRVIVAASNRWGKKSAASPHTRVVRKKPPPGTPPPSSPSPTGGPSPTGTAAFGGIHVVGNHLANSEGQTVSLHGVNRSGTEYNCVHGYGITDGPNSHDTNPTEFGPMKSWDINSVFIGLNEDCWLGINGAGINNWSADSGQNYINEIKAEVAQAESDGIYPVIGFFWGDPGTVVPTGTGPNGGGQPSLPDSDHAPLFWEEVAQTFKNDPNVIFRLQEEPHPCAGCTNGGSDSTLAEWQCWSQGDVQYATTSDSSTYGVAPTPVSSASHCNLYATDGSTHYSAVGMQSLINIIRGTGSNNVIQVPALDYANVPACTNTGNPTTCGFLDSSDHVKVTDPLASKATGSQLMLDLDIYPDNGQYCASTTCYNDTIAPVAAVMPVDIGEIAPNGSTDTQTLVFLNWLDSHGESNYYAWAWDTWSNLINNYSGTPQSPWGVTYFDRLTGYVAAPPAQPTDGIVFRQVVPQACVNYEPRTVTLSKPVAAGDHLFLVIGGMSYASPVTNLASGVSDNVNGAWTMVMNTGSQYDSDPNFNESAVVYQVQSSNAAPNGLTISVAFPATGASGGDSAVAVDVGGVGSEGPSAFDSSPQPSSATTYTGPAIPSVPAGDVVLGLFNSYSHGSQSYSAPTGWNTSAPYWTVSADCASAAVDWTQTTASGSVTPAILSTGEYHYGGGIVLRP